MVRSASSAYVIRMYEATFGSGGTVEHKFGYDEKISGLEWANNQSPLPALYTPEVEAFLYNRNSGGCSIEYTMGSSYWLTALLGDPTTETGADPFTRTWESDPDVTDSTSRFAKSQHLEFGKALTAENVVRQAKGVITQSINLKSSIDNPVALTETMVWGIEDAIGTTLDSSLPDNAEFSPMNFVNSTVEMPDANVITTIQDLDLTLNRNMELLYGLGSADAVDAYPKVFEATGKITLAYLDKTHLQQVKDRVEIAGMTIIISNGLATTEERTVTLTFTGCGLSRHGAPTVSPGEPIFQEYDFQCRHLTAVSIDGTAVFNWD